VFELIFFGPRLLAEAHPLACFGVAVAFIGLQAAMVSRTGGRFSIAFFRYAPTFAGVLWVVYGLYEPQVRAGFPNVGIRFDLLVLVPILYVFSGVALWSLWHQWRTGQLPTRTADKVAEPPGEEPPPGS
jgi:hypothetical protein